MIKTSVIIPTFNRFEELTLTLPQIAKILDEKSELIVFDQSTEYEPSDAKLKLQEIMKNCNFKYFHSKTPSVTLAWNTAASIAKGEILLFLDDDIDIVDNIIELHLRKYENNKNISGVAGSYYASSFERIWSPSSKNGVATTVAGVNVSFLKDVFNFSGAASNYKKPFAAFDWEIAEHVNRNFGKILAGHDVLVYHRAPSKGGCGNQSFRDLKWYYGAYHNHFLWMLSRQFPYKITRLPRHFYWIFKYCLPTRSLLFTKNFLFKTLTSSFKDALSSYKLANNTRAAEKLNIKNYNLICEIEFSK